MTSPTRAGATLRLPAPGFVLGPLGKRAGTGGPLDKALALARAQAARQGYAVPVYRVADRALIADVFPDGQIDLTWEGAKIA